MASLEAIRAGVRAVIEGHSSPVKVYKYITGTVNAYKQRAGTFAEAVTVLGHVAFRPTAEMLSAVGEESAAAGMVTFSRLTLEAAFPTAPLGKAIEDDDELGIDGVRYRIVGVHLTGRIAGVYEIMVVTFDTTPGREGEVAT